MINKTECELYAPIHLPFYRSLVFFSRFIVHLQSSSSPLFANLYAFIILFPLHTYLLLYTNVLSTVKAKSFFHNCSCFIVSVHLHVTYSPRPTTEYLRFLLPSHPTLFLDSYLCGPSSILSCAFTLEMTGKPERSRWKTGLRETTEECVEWLGMNNEL